MRGEESKIAICFADLVPLSAGQGVFMVKEDQH